MDHATPHIPAQPGPTPYAATPHSATSTGPIAHATTLHSIGTSESPTTHGTTFLSSTPPDPTPPGLAAERSTRAERQARAEWLVTELGRLAARADDPHDQARLRRTADSLVRLATAFRS